MSRKGFYVDVHHHHIYDCVSARRVLTGLGGDGWVICVFSLQNGRPPTWPPIWNDQGLTCIGALGEDGGRRNETVLSLNGKGLMMDRPIRHGCALE